MARSKQPVGLTELPPPAKAEDDFDSLPSDDGNSESPGEYESALAARVRELEAELANVRASAIADVEPGARADYWRVELESARPHVVRASDAANAWEAYCREMGVISSDHRPRVSPASREQYHEAQARRHGCKPEEYELPEGE